MWEFAAKLLPYASAAFDAKCKKESGASGEINVSVDAWSAPGTYTLKISAEANTEYLLKISPRSGSLQAGYLSGIDTGHGTVYSNSTAAPFIIAIKATHH
jgi:hypothetical protein